MIRLPIAAAILALGLAAVVTAADPPPPTVHIPPSSAPSTLPAARGTTHTLNLKDADINVLIATVSEITGKNFIVDPRVEGKVTVVSAQAMKPDEIYGVFQSVLRVHGYATVESGSMIKIVPEPAAHQDGSAGLNGDRSHDADELVSQIVAVKHVSAAELMPLLRPLMPQGGQMIAHTGSNSLIVSDRAGNIQRLIKIIERIDRASDTEVEVIRLQHASAAEMARTLTVLADDKTGGANGETAKVMADERTNSILLSGGKNGRLRLRTLISHLDTPLESGDATNVIYLSNANAKDLVPILESVAQTLTGESGAKEAARSATIQAHDGTNAIVITAQPAVFRALSQVVRQLDVRRAQVLIEAVIAEVSDDVATEIGVQWNAPVNGLDDNTFIGGTNFTGPNGTGNILNVARDPLAVGTGLALGYITGTTTIAGTEILNLGALVRALKGDGKSNILSTPSILTLDNQEAVIKVGQEVPFVTGSYSNASSSAGTQPNNPFQTIDRKDVGITLTVTPHINEGDSVRLDIHQEVSSLAPNVQGASDLVTNKRELQTSVLVSDDTVLVLGGLISDEVKENVQKVPGLGDIPVLGNLFKYRSNTRVRRNLMIFLHPRILRDAATEGQVSSEKYNFMRAEQLKVRDLPGQLTPDREQPLLPESRDFLRAPIEPENK